MKSEDDLNVPFQVLTEVFSIIHSEGLWGMLSPDTKIYGENLYKELTGQELNAPPGAMRYTIEQ